MRLTFDDDVESFRAEFSAFLDDNLPTEAETFDVRGPSRICQRGPGSGSAYFSTRAGCSPRSPRNSADATRPYCSSSSISMNCVDDASTTVSTRRASILLQRR